MEVEVDLVPRYIPAGDLMPRGKGAVSHHEFACDFDVAARELHETAWDWARSRMETASDADVTRVAHQMLKAALLRSQTVQIFDRTRKAK